MEDSTCKNSECTRLCIFVIVLIRLDIDMWYHTCECGECEKIISLLQVQPLTLTIITLRYASNNQSKISNHGKTVLIIVYKELLK